VARFSTPDVHWQAMFEFNLFSTVRAVGADRDTVLDTIVPTSMQLTTGRMVEPQEIADAVVLLASPRSASTTGAEFIVDAGCLKSV
jgi:enoyl-[acyl-carrier-protein] reductase (NADH)